MDTAILDNLTPASELFSEFGKDRKIVRIIFFILLVFILVPGLAAVTYFLLQGNIDSGTAFAMSEGVIAGTPTPTPFQPLDPTPTYIPTLVPTVPPDRGSDKEDSSPGNSGPAGEIAQSNENINILVLGSDQRPYDGGFRTDTIILVSINKSKKTVSMVSFPRDLYVLVPGWSYQRINTAMLYGGFNLMAETLAYNFGVKPTHYVMANFDAFQKIIDKLGGIEVEVGSNFRDIYLDGNYKRFPAGTAHMNGATALWYARSRQTSNDFDRARRQQEVLHAVFKRILKADVLENARGLYDLYVDNIDTNLTWSEIASIISLSVHLKDPSKIQRYVIGPEQVYDWITPGGAMVLVPYQDQIINLVKEAIGEK